jgi:hypothetical protein
MARFKLSVWGNQDIGECRFGDFNGDGKEIWQNTLLPARNLAHEYYASILIWNGRDIVEHCSSRQRGRQGGHSLAKHLTGQR